MKNFQALLAAAIVAGSAYGAFNTQIMVFTEDAGQPLAQCVSIGAIPSGSLPCDDAFELDKNAPVTVISKATDSVVYSLNPANVATFGGLINSGTPGTAPCGKINYSNGDRNPVINFTVNKLIVVHSACWNSASSSKADSAKFYAYGNGETNNFACITIDGAGGIAMISPSFYTNSGSATTGTFKKKGSSRNWSSGESVNEIDGMKIKYGSFSESHKKNKTCKICFPVNSLSLIYEQTSAGIEITDARIVV